MIRFNVSQQREPYLFVVDGQSNESAHKVEEAEMVSVDARLRVRLVDAGVRDVEQSVHRIENLLGQHRKPLPLDSRTLNVE